MSVKLPSKSNSNEIRFAPGLWAIIREYVELWRRHNSGKKPYWIGPSEEVKVTEEEIAWRYKAGENGRWVQKEPLRVVVRLIGQRVDIDNALKVLLDGLEKSGRLGDDRQVKDLWVRHLPGQTPSVEVEVTPIGS